MRAHNMQSVSAAGTRRPFSPYALGDLRCRLRPRDVSRWRVFKCLIRRSSADAGQWGLMGHFGALTQSKLNGQGVAEKPGGAFSNSTVSEPLPITGRISKFSP